MNSRNHLPMLAIVPILGLGCMNDEPDTSARRTTDTQGAEGASIAATPGHRDEPMPPEQTNRSTAMPIAPDNGLITVAPQEPPPTAQNQSESAADVEISRSVRQLLVNDDSLSIMARNVTIVTRDGVVTLRGDVNSMSERSKVERHARNVRGVTRVENLIVADGT